MILSVVCRLLRVVQNRRYKVYCALQGLFFAVACGENSELNLAGREARIRARERFFPAAVIACGERYRPTGTFV